MTRLVFAVLCLLAVPAYAFTGRVIHIADGDTLTVLVEHQPVRVRIHGIDAPEKRQPFGTRAKQYAAWLAFGKTVTVQVRDRDRYGRIVGDVILPDRRDLNHLMVAAGYAWRYVKYAPHDAELERLEQDARIAHRGLWADRQPVAPWDWRLNH